MVGQKAEPLPGFGIHVADAPESMRVVALCLAGAQSDNLIAAQSGILVDRFGLQDTEPGIAFRADDEVGADHFDAEQPGEVEVSSVENIDAPFFEPHCIHEVNVVHGPVADAHEHGNRPVQIELRMELDGRLGATEMSPRKHRQAQTDGSSVHGVNHLVEIEAIGVVGIQTTSFADENLSERFVNPPVAMFVRVGEIRSSDVPANPHRAQMRATAKARFDVSKALAKSHLSESHREKLIARSHAFAYPRHRMQSHAAIELLAVNQLGDLGEDQASGVHPLLRMNPNRLSQPVQMRHIDFSSLDPSNQPFTKL